MFSVAYCITKRPVGVDPVKAAFDTFLLVTKALPSSAPKPLTIFIRVRIYLVATYAQKYLKIQFYSRF